MVAKNIRKEISQLIYVLKKFKKNTFLIRPNTSSEAEILQKMLNVFIDINEGSEFRVNGVRTADFESSTFFNLANES